MKAPTSEESRSRYEVGGRESLPVRTLTASFWHQCSRKHRLVDLADPAVTWGRYHRAGGPGVWYALSTENGAWAELFRHHEAGGVSPFEVIRRIGRARTTGLRVLDLTSASVRETVGVSARELISDHLDRCQEIALYAQQLGLDGILAPSAALDGQRTLVVFSAGMRKIAEQNSRVGRPPARARRVLRRVRFRHS